MANELKRSRYNKVDAETEGLINPKNMEYLDKYKKDMTIRELSKNTIYNYERDMMKFYNFVYLKAFNQDVSTFTSDDIEDFIYDCQVNGNNTERIRRLLCSLSAFYAFLLRKGVIDENPCDNIIRPKKGMKVVTQTYLTEMQCKELIRKLEDYGNLQLLIYVRLSLETMGRVNALANITFSQIDYDNLMIHDVVEKGGRAVDLFFEEETGELLQRLQRRRQAQGIYSEYVFISQKQNKISVEQLAQWCKKAGELIGVHTLHPHDFRHSAATLLRLNNCPIEVIADLLNHNNIDTTMRYYIEKDRDKLRSERDKYMKVTKSSKRK